MANINSADFFTLDGVSSASVGLYVDTPPVPPLAKQRYTTWTGALDADGCSPDDVFDNITLNFDCYCFFTVNFSLAPLYAFLQGKSTLQFSRFPDRFFKIRQVNGITPVQQYDGNRIKMNVSFVCSPFKYHTANTEFTPENNVITNPGTRFSRPVYKITNTSAGGQVYYTNGSITVNGQELQIDFGGASQKTVVVDAEKMIAYDDSTHENLTRYTSGLFPFLSPGNNAIVTDKCTVTVIGNWRDY